MRVAVKANLTPALLAHLRALRGADDLKSYVADEQGAILAAWKGGGEDLKPLDPGAARLQELYPGLAGMLGGSGDQKPSRIEEDRNRLDADVFAEHDRARPFVDHDLGDNICFHVQILDLGNKLDMPGGKRKRLANRNQAGVLRVRDGFVLLSGEFRIQDRRDSRGGGEVVAGRGYVRRRLRCTSGSGSGPGSPRPRPRRSSVRPG